jgi:hypothetical protein
VDAEAHIDERGTSMATRVRVKDAIPGKLTKYARIEKIAKSSVSKVAIVREETPRTRNN